MVVNPTAIRIEVCSVCQLRCPLCPNIRGETAATIGMGYMPFEHFRRLINQNPQIRQVELGNFGEVFLNKDLPGILEYAYTRNVTTTIDEGANLNHSSEEALEALVKYQTAVVRCAIDGITQATYSQYRVGGDLKNVLRNIQKINRHKGRYQSSRPRLLFQFIIFGHNEHEIERAILLSRMLKMEISFKLNFFPDAMPVYNRDRVRQIVDYADRREYLEKEGVHYKRHQCYELWLSPQINWDGKLLGCSRNMWGVFGGNVFESGLMGAINNEKIRYAREMLMGRVPARGDMPCMKCSIYQSIATSGNWITEKEIKDAEVRNANAEGVCSK
ncbi:MAG: Radical protein [Candidatus Brocadiaceae bacterium]|nr:Radical protein [Candidatus Brocadiaceae bacterium]